MGYHTARSKECASHRYSAVRFLPDTNWRGQGGRLLEQEVLIAAARHLAPEAIYDRELWGSSERAIPPA